MKKRRCSRRQLLGGAITAGVVGIAVPFTTGDDQTVEEPLPAAKLVTGKVVSPLVVTAKHVSKDTISDDGLASTWLFDNFVASVDEDQNATPQTPHAVVVFEHPIADGNDEKLIGCIVDIRGHVNKTKGAAISLVATISGQSTSIEVPFGEEQNGGFERRIFVLHPGTSATKLEHDNDEPNDRMGTTWRSLDVSIVVSVHKSTSQESGLIQVDSIDFELQRGPCGTNS